MPESVATDSDGENVATMMWSVVKDSVAGFQEHNCNRMAAATAYYTIFSLPAVLVVVVSVAGLLVEPTDVEGRIEQEISSVVGEEGADQVRTMLQHANRPGRGIWGTVIGVGMLLFGATGVMAQLQAALNEVWEVMPKPDANPIRVFFVKRIMSLGMLLSVAFMLLVSLTLSALVAAVGDQIGAIVPDSVSESGLKASNACISYLIIVAMFAGIYRYMPDVRLAWRDVFVGAAATGLLFVIGKNALAIYLASSSVASTYGAAGSLALILVWVYYSSLIFLFGAELTRSWRRTNRGPARPERGAVRVRRTIEPTVDRHNS